MLRSMTISGIIAMGTLIGASVIRWAFTLWVMCITNTIEGFFSILKRGIYGVYQHVSEAHLKRYLCEFDFRYSLLPDQDRLR